VNRYFKLVNTYCQGAADEFVRYVATSAMVAAEATEVSAAELAKLPSCGGTWPGPGRARPTRRLFTSSSTGQHLT